MYRRHKKVLLLSTVLAMLGMAACSQQVAGDRLVSEYGGDVAANMSGAWARDYSRGDDVNRVMNDIYRKLQRYASDPRMVNDPRVNSGSGALSSRNIAAVQALARFADEITRMDAIDIEQDVHEISIKREDDFAIFCEFYEGRATGPQTEHGAEICGWDNHQFVSRLVLPDGVRVTHRFTMSEDGKNLHVATTVSSKSANIPVTLNRYYSLFDRPKSDLNCVETLSMKRVCSTTDITQ
jgi:hypothetical protein